MLIDWPTLQLYLVAATLIVLVPGPDTFLVLGRSVALGRRAGWITALGTTGGNVVHATLAALGVSAVIAASPWFFDALRLLGAAYLAWLGYRSLASAWRAWRSDEALPLTANDAVVGWQRLFISASLTNLLNPKAILFYLAFLPQFVDPTKGAIGAQTLMLGLLLAFMALIFYLTLAVTAAGLASRALRAPKVRALIDAMAGVVFFGFAVRVLLTERRVA